MKHDNRFNPLGYADRIWAVSAINGDVEKLRTMHQAIWDDFKVGDRIVYHGNYFGYTKESNPRETIDELLRFRRYILQPGVLPEDIAYLRGLQEELWQKLLQIQFAPNPSDILNWLSKQGLSIALNAYGSSINDGLHAAKSGILGLTKWTNSLREAIRNSAGHEQFFISLRRAAYTQGINGADHLLFVNSGINTSLPLDQQGDSFWLNTKSFDQINAPYQHFNYIIRGSDPRQQGVQVKENSISLDSGCGFGGPLTCAQISNTGQITSLLQS